MILQGRVIIIFLVIALLVLAVIGGVLPSTLHKQNLDTVAENSMDQLRHIDLGHMHPYTKRQLRCPGAVHQ